MQPWIRRLTTLHKQHNSPIAKAALNKFTAAGFPLQSSRYETLALLPILIRNPAAYTEQIESMYDAFRQEYTSLKHYEQEKFPADTDDHHSPVAFLSYVRAKTIFQEAQCLVLALCIVFNALLSDCRRENEELDEERVAFCADAVVAVEESKIGRPFGALQVPIVAVAAWLSSRDEVQKEELMALLDDYKDTFAMNHFLRQAAKWKDAPRRLKALSWFPLNNEAGEFGRGYGRGEKVNVDVEKCCIL